MPRSKANNAVVLEFFVLVILPKGESFCVKKFSSQLLRIQKLGIERSFESHLFEQKRLVTSLPKHVHF